ncbi:pre-peptidase C-terminal domain-containing protein [Candidatus Laterigemmans baculatus]|uniref:pre-peptidase C-terminal domain-containing protein n=1 Tax=Candidatus Laterigemmans baculatus TaxID=2770505 RepID=UPI0013DD6F1F|nr:pre-peptidase C-terminal domain-containing protein [Candidatus Laterigemmans baculatus]
MLLAAAPFGDVAYASAASAFPALEPQLPLGSLVYQGEQAGAIELDGERDTFTLDVDPGQSLTVVLAADDTLRASVEIRRSPDADAVHAEADSAGEAVVLQSIPTRGRLIGNGPPAATYEIVVSSLDGSTGGYTLQTILNAAAELEEQTGATNDDPATAQDLAAAFQPLAQGIDDDSDGDGRADRAAVIGRLGSDGTTTVPSVFAEVDGDSATDIPFNVSRFYNKTSMRFQQIYSASEFTEGGLIDELRFRRDAWAEAFEERGIDVQVKLSYAARSVDTLSQRFAENVGADQITVFDGLLDLESDGEGIPRPFDIVIDVDDVFVYDPSRGDLLVEMQIRNAATVPRFDYARGIQQSTTNSVYAFDADATDGAAYPWNLGGLVTQFGIAANEDWYRFTREAGESTTIALSELSAGQATLELYAADGTQLARGVSDALHASEVIADFAAEETAGTYYVRVSGEGNTQYNLVVTRNAALESTNNDSIASAQELIPSASAGRRWVLGGIDGSSDFYAVTVEGNRMLTLETDTPGSGSGDFVNDLDPMLRLYDSEGQLVAVDDDGSPVGQNAKLRYKVPKGAGGVYYVEVLSSEAASPTTGEYILSVQHADAVPGPFEATIVAPPEAYRTRTAPTHATVDFNDAVWLPSVDASDLSVSGVTATDVIVVDGNTLTFELPSYAFPWDLAQGGNGNYYMLTDRTTSWAEAAQWAEALGGQLVSIDSDRERQFLEHHFLSGDHRDDSYWLHGGSVFSSLSESQPARQGIVELTELPPGIWSLNDGVHTLAIADGAVSDVQSTPVSGGSSTVLVDLTAPRVVGVSPQSGAVAASGDFEVTITFSEPIDAAALDPSGLTLAGHFREGHFTHDSLQWNAEGTALTLSYSSLPDDRYALTIPSGVDGIQDLLGWQLDGEGQAVPSGDGFEGGSFRYIFAVDPSSAASFSAPLYPVAPAGSLIHDSQFTTSPGGPATAGADGTIAHGDDQDDFTIHLDPHQTLTVVVETEDALQPTIEILDPSGTVVGSGEAVGVREAAVALAPATAGGIYTIRVGGVAGSMGLYSVRAVLNADIEREFYGGENDSIATAHNLESSFTSLLKGAERGAILGRADGIGTGLGPDGFGYMATSVPFSFEDISTTGTLIEEFYLAYPARTSTFDGYAPLSDADLGDFEFEFYGATYRDLFVSIDGFLTFRWGVVAPDNSDLRYSPSPPIIAALWDDYQLFGGSGKVYWQVSGEGDAQELTIQWSNLRLDPSWNHHPQTFQVVLREADNSIQVNYLNLATGYDATAEGATATVGIKDSWSQPALNSRRLTASYNDASNRHVGTGQSLRFHLPDPTADYYAVELEAGEKLTVATTALDAGVVDVELVDGSSSILASGHNVSVGEDVIANFELPSSGTYYVRVRGDLDVDYSLVLTRNAVFDTEGNSTPRIAQDLAGLKVALGHVGGPAATPGNVRVAVHANDWDWTSRQGALRVATQLNDSSVYDFTATVVANDSMDTVEELENYDVVIIGSWFYREFPMDVAKALRSWVESGSGGLVAIGNANRQLTQFTTDQRVRAMMDPIIPLDLGYNNVPYAYAPLTVVDSLHPVTHGITEVTGIYQGESSFNEADADAQVLGIEGSWAKRPGITVSEASGGRTVHLMPQYGWPDYTDLRVPGSSADRLLEQAVAWATPPGLDEADVYAFNAEAGATLDLFTTTPGDGSGAFANTLDPRLTLYDAAGNVVATGIPMADGRNEQIVYTVPAGAGGRYRIAVAAENGTAGQYVLDPVQVAPPESLTATSEATPEIVSSTAPQPDAAAGDSGDEIGGSAAPGEATLSGLSWEESPQDDYESLAVAQLEAEEQAAEEGPAEEPPVDQLFADTASLEEVLQS